MIRGRPDLRPALVLLPGLAAALTVLALASFAQAGGDAAWPSGVLAVMGLADVVIGVVAWDRRPSNRIGPLLCVTGFLTLGSTVGDVADPVVAGVGFLLAESPIAALLHLTLAFPSGRLRGRLARALVIAGYAVTVGFQVPMILLDPAARPFYDDLQSLTGSAVLVLAAVLVLRRVGAAPARTRERRVRATVTGYGVVTLLFLPFSARLLAPLFDLSPTGLFVLQLTVFAWIPVVFAAGVLRGGFTRTAGIEQLGAWLGSDGDDRPTLRQALADTVGDPTLELYYPRDGELVDSAGRPVPVPVPPDRRPGAARDAMGTVRVTGSDGLPVLITYDATLVPDPAPVLAAGRIVALACERERLLADVTVGKEAVRASRARILRVADDERRRVAQDLHDLLQSRLLLAGLHAGRLGDGPAARRLQSELEGAITELRRQVHGLMPALLVERGLVAAVEELTDRLPLPVTLDVEFAEGSPLPPAVVSSGYFVVAEALANAVKHAGAERLGVRIARDGAELVVEICDDGVGGARPTGAGLRGMADRADALGGSLTVTSPVGGGTRIAVRLPCGS